jgi:dTDP-4-dehydrorhamnose reductase
MERASIKDFAGPTRPADTSLNCAKIQALLSFPLPALSEWMQDNPSESI